MLLNFSGSAVGCHYTCMPHAEQTPCTRARVPPMHFCRNDFVRTRHTRCDDDDDDAWRCAFTTLSDDGLPIFVWCTAREGEMGVIDHYNFEANEEIELHTTSNRQQQQLQQSVCNCVSMTGQNKKKKYSRSVQTCEIWCCCMSVSWLKCDDSDWNSIGRRSPLISAVPLLHGHYATGNRG